MPNPVKYEARDGSKTWRVRFRHRGRQTSETFHTLAAAKIFCADIDSRGVEYAMRLRDAEDREALRGKTLDQVLEDYLEWRTPRFRTDRTVKDYRRRYELAIKPALGGMPVAAITPEAVQKWVDDLHVGKVGAKLRIVEGERIHEPISPKTIADRHALLHSLMKHAMRRHWTDSDPCADTDLPKRHKRPPKGLRPAEWQALYAALQQIDPDAADLAFFMLSTGWRWGEATALTTYDVEDDGRNMWATVSQVMRRNATGRTVIVQDAKSEAGLERRVRLDPGVHDLMRRRVSRARSGALVFTTKTGAAWHHSHFRSRAWEPAVDVANLNRRPTPHWLRHTHVAWMVIGGANLPELKARIGHASIETTIDVYGRMVSDVSDDALSAFAAMRGGGHPQIES